MNNTCKGKIKVNGENIVVSRHHTHQPDPIRRDVLRIRDNLRNRAQNTQEAPRQVLLNGLAGINDAVAAHMPNLETVRRDIRRQRQRAGNPLAVPASRDDVPNPIPNEYTVTNNNAPFLVWDSGDNDRILIFATEEKLRLLQNTEHWFADGTFDTVPNIYSQLYTFHAMIQGMVVTCLYALLPNKTRATYTKLIQQLLHLNPNFNPESLMVLPIYFEIGFILSFQQLFPATLIKGCFFHLSQIIYPQVVDHGLLARYRDDVEFVQEVRMIAALSFVPVNDVIDAFNALAGNADANLQPILDHIEDNYIDHMRRGHFRPARFPMSMWNMHDRVLDNLPLHK